MAEDLSPPESEKENIFESSSEIIRKDSPQIFEDLGERIVFYKDIRPDIIDVNNLDPNTIKQVAYIQSRFKDQLSPIGTKLNGLYTPINQMPFAIQKIIKTSDKIVLIRELTNPDTGDGGRTQGTMWYKQQVLGFTVEDYAQEDKKVATKTAIPDSFRNLSAIYDPNNKNNAFALNGASYYNLILSSFAKEFIEKVFYDGKGIRISSKRDKTGNSIYEEDVFVNQDFETSPENARGVAFSGAFIHQGDSERSSHGCIIFGCTRADNGTLPNGYKPDGGIKENIALNKFLVENKVIGPGLFEQLLIINLWSVPRDSFVTQGKLQGQVYDGQTGQLIPGTEASFIEAQIKPLTPQSINQSENSIISEPLNLKLSKKDKRKLFFQKQQLTNQEMIRKSQKVFQG